MDMRTVLEWIVGNSPIAMQLLDSQGTAIRVNDAFLTLFGFSDRTEVEGLLNVRALPLYTDEWRTQMDRAYCGEVASTPTIHYISSQSRESYLGITLIPLMDDDGAVDSVLSVFEDITAMMELEQGAHHRDRLLMGLQRAYRSITNSLLLDDVMDAVMSAAQSVLGADKVSLWQVDPEGILVCVKRKGLHQEYVPKPGDPAMEMYRSFGDAFIRASRPVILSDESPNPEFYAHLKREGINRALAVPIRHGDSVTGALTLYYRESGSFEPGDIEAACLLADQAAIALHNAALFQELRTMRDDLEARVQAATQELEKAHAEALANERLATAGFLSREVAHGLRNPLNVISASTYYLQSQFPATDEKVKRHFGAISRAVGQAADTITHLIALTGGSAPVFTNLDLSALAQRAINDLRLPEGTAIETSWAPGLSPARGDSQQLLQAVKPLIANALASRRNAPVRVETHRSGGFIVLSVGDDRPPLSPEERDSAFAPFKTSATQWTGLSLSVARQIARRHQGDLCLDIEDGFTWFRMQVPVAADAAG